MSGYRIGLDLGGTKIEARLLDADGNEPIAPIRVATPRGDYSGIVAILARLAREAEAAVSASDLPVGIAIPGTVCPVRKVVKNANSTWLNDQPLHEDVAKALGREVRCENDANCFALSEAMDGAGQGASVVFGIILGTGVGSGVVVDGRIVGGANGLTGEWGHNPLPSVGEPDGRSCYCGRRDCVETYLCGPALEAEYAERCGRQSRATEIADAARAGTDADAQTVYALWEKRFAASLAGVVNLLDPDIVVLGGGLSNIVGLPGRIGEQIVHNVFNTSGAPLATRFAVNRHGDSSGARGAAWLAAG